MKDLMSAGLTDTVNYSSGSWEVGGTKLNTNAFYNDFSAFCDNWHYSYPTYNIVHEKPNPTELAFKIVGKMLEKKIIERMTVKQFIETINEIAALI